MRVLLIDDEPRFRGLVTPVLEACGLQVVQASDVQEAEEELSFGAFDLIILDGVLRNTDGESWLRSRREAGDSSNVMFVSAAWRETEAYHRLINELKVSLVIHKPISPQVFAQQVAQVLSCADAPESVIGIENDVAIELAALAAEFTEELPGKLRALIENLSAIASGAHDEQAAYARALRVSHMLAGTGTSFGHEWLSDLASMVEVKLKQFGTSILPLNRHSAADLRELVKKGLNHADVTPVNVSQTRTSVESAGVAYTPCKTARVLVIDDDSFFTRRVEQLLSGEGIIVTTFNDTVRAFDLIEDVGPDLVVLDVNMPGVSGHDICRALRRDPKWKHLPILIVTTDTPWSASSMAIAVGATDYMTKPVSNAELLDGVLKHLPQMLDIAHMA